MTGAKFSIQAILDGFKGSGHLIDAADLEKIAKEAASQPDHCIIRAKHIVGEQNDMIEIKISFHPEPPHEG